MDISLNCVITPPVAADLSEMVKKKKEPVSIATMGHGKLSLGQRRAAKRPLSLNLRKLDSDDGKKKKSAFLDELKAKIAYFYLFS